jgi:hypothetical protein
MENNIICSHRSMDRESIHIGTIHGARTIRTPYAVHVETGGMDHMGNLWVTVWTSQDRTTGYHVRQNVHNDKRSLQRLKRIYMDQSTVRKYGRKQAVVTELLPIIPSK